MFRGTFQHAIDAKGRTSLPAKFREQIAAKGSEVLIVTTGPDGALWGYAQDAWDRLVARFAEKSPFDKDVRAFVNRFVSPAQDCPFDKLGRVLVPPMLRAHAGITAEGGEVVWAGALDHIELYSADAWKKRNDALAGVLESDPFAAAKAS